MNRHFYQNLLYLLMLAFCACETASTSSNPSVPSTETAPTSSSAVSQTAEQSNYKPKYLEEFDIDNENLSYGNYQIERQIKPLIINGKRFENSLNFAVLTKRGRFIAKFDGLYNPNGTEIRYGLIPLLGQNTKQLVVEQTANRDWQYWVVNLDQKARITFDSGNYAVGQSLRIFDIDGDGKEELILSLTTFWFFERLNSVDSPFIDIVFAYDSTLKRYVPANQRFQDFTLREVEKQIGIVRKTKPEWKGDGGFDGGVLSAVLKVMLPYVYAGKKQEAWKFYEAWYNLPDKVEMKSKIEKTLNNDFLCRIIYR